MKSVAIAIACLSALSVSAAGWTAPPEAWTINIKAQSPDNQTGGSGPCTGGAGLANICPPAHVCGCFISTGSASGATGHGTVTFYETIDQTQQTISGSTSCATAYGDIEIAGAKDTESIGFVAGDCLAEPFGTSPFTNPETIGGGCLLDSSSKRFSAAFGNCSGGYGPDNTNTHSFPVTFKISGKALKK